MFGSDVCRRARRRLAPVSKKAPEAEQSSAMNFRCCPDVVARPTLLPAARPQTLKITLRPKSNVREFKPSSTPEATAGRSPHAARNTSGAKDEEKPMSADKALRLKDCIEAGRAIQSTLDILSSSHVSTCTENASRRIDIICSCARAHMYVRVCIYVQMYEWHRDEEAISCACMLYHLLTAARNLCDVFPNACSRIITQTHVWKQMS